MKVLYRFKCKWFCFYSGVILQKFIYFALFFVYYDVVVFCKPFCYVYAVLFVVFSEKPGAHSLFKEFFHLVVFSLTVVVLESFSVFCKLDSAADHSTGVLVLVLDPINACLHLLRFFRNESCVPVFWPVTFFQVVSKVTVRATLLLAKAAVPFVLGFLAGNSLVFPCELFFCLSAVFSAFSAPSGCGYSPVAHVFIDCYNYFVLL